MHTIYKILSEGQTILETSSWKAVFLKCNKIISSESPKPFLVLAFNVSDIESTIMANLPNPNLAEYDAMAVPTIRSDKQLGQVKETILFTKETQWHHGYAYTYWCVKTPDLKWQFPSVMLF